MTYFIDTYSELRLSAINSHEMDDSNIDLTDLKVSLSNEDSSCSPKEETPRENSNDTQPDEAGDLSMGDEYCDPGTCSEEEAEMSEDTSESNDAEDESSDDEDLLQTAFMIDPSQLSSGNSASNLPINGHDYLRHVQIEREKYPAISYAKPPPPRLDKKCPPAPWVEMLLSKSNREDRERNLVQSP